MNPSQRLLNKLKHKRKAWACVACSIENPALFLRCSVCDSVAPQEGLQSALQSTSSGSTGSWTCLTCTLINSEETRVCALCCGVRGTDTTSSDCEGSDDDMPALEQSPAQELTSSPPPHRQLRVPAASRAPPPSSRRHPSSAASARLCSPEEEAAADGVVAAAIAEATRSGRQYRDAAFPATGASIGAVRSLISHAGAASGIKGPPFLWRRPHDLADERWRFGPRCRRPVLRAVELAQRGLADADDAEELSEIDTKALFAFAATAPVGLMPALTHLIMCAPPEWVLRSGPFSGGDVVQVRQGGNGLWSARTRRQRVVTNHERAAHASPSYHRTIPSCRVILGLAGSSARSLFLPTRRQEWITFSDLYRLSTCSGLPTALAVLLVQPQPQNRKNRFSELSCPPNLKTVTGEMMTGRMIVPLM